MAARNSKMARRVAPRTVGSVSLLEVHQTAEHRSTAIAEPQANTTAEGRGSELMATVEGGAQDILPGGPLRFRPVSTPPASPRYVAVALLHCKKAPLSLQQDF